MDAAFDADTAMVRSEVDGRNRHLPVPSFGDRSRRATSLIGLLLAAVAIMLALIAVRLDNGSTSPAGGLLSGAPNAYWGAIAAGLVATAALLVAGRDPADRTATVVPMMWLVLLHTMPRVAGLPVDTPGRETLALAGRLQEAGIAGLDNDPRAGWPGFLAALPAPLAELPTTMVDVALALWPSLVIGGTAIVVAGLARRSYPTLPLIGTVSALGYVLLAWMGDDHLAPQSVGVLVAMVVLVLVESGPLRVAESPVGSTSFLGRLVTGGGDRPSSRARPVTVVLLLLGLGAVVTHPQAPIMMAATLLVLGLYGRGVALRLLAVMAVAWTAWVLLATWFSTGGRPEGWLLWDGGWDPGPNLAVGNGWGAGPGGALVWGPLVIAWISGLSVVLRRFRHLRPAIPLIPLMAAPTVAAVLLAISRPEAVAQTLPFLLAPAAVVLARLTLTVRGRWMPVAVVALTACLVPLFLVARYGSSSSSAESAASMTPDVVVTSCGGEDSCVTR